MKTLVFKFIMFILDVLGTLRGDTFIYYNGYLPSYMHDILGAMGFDNLGQLTIFRY